MTPTLRSVRADGRKKRKLDFNLKKPLLLVCTNPNCVSSPMMWRLANKSGSLTVGNKVVGSAFMFEAHFDWSIRIPVVSMVYSQRWLIVSAGLKALFWALHPLCCCYFSLSGFMHCLCVCVCISVCALSWTFLKNTFKSQICYVEEKKRTSSNYVNFHVQCSVCNVCVCFIHRDDIHFI